MQKETEHEPQLPGRTNKGNGGYCRYHKWKRERRKAGALLSQSRGMGCQSVKISQAQDRHSVKADQVALPIDDDDAVIC